MHVAKNQAQVANEVRKRTFVEISDTDSGEVIEHKSICQRFWGI